MQQSIDIDIRRKYHKLYEAGGINEMRKSISISIRVSEEELDKFKEASRLEAYSSYSEFIRRTALIEAEKVIRQNEQMKGEQ